MYTPSPIPDVRMETGGVPPTLLRARRSRRRGHSLEKFRQRIDGSEVPELQTIKVDSNRERRLYLQHELQHLDRVEPDFVDQMCGFGKTREQQRIRLDLGEDLFEGCRGAHACSIRCHRSRFTARPIPMKGPRPAYCSTYSKHWYSVERLTSFQ